MRDSIPKFDGAFVLERVMIPTVVLGMQMYVLFTGKIRRDSGRYRRFFSVRRSARYASGLRALKMN